MNSKKNQLFLILFIGIVLSSCNGKKYIYELPYQYSSEDFTNAKSNEKEEMSSAYSVVDDNPQGLNDDTLRIKEKYSIIMEVMPKEIRDYKLYSYLDDWIGTLIKKQMLEKQVGVESILFRSSTL